MTVDGVVVMGSLSVGGAGCSGKGKERYKQFNKVNNKHRSAISY